MNNTVDTESKEAKEKRDKARQDEDRRARDLQEGKQPNPGEPGYYSPPTAPSVTTPQGVPHGPHTAAAIGPRPPEETGQPQPTPEEIETRKKAGDPSLGEKPFRDAMQAAGRGKEADEATRPTKAQAGGQPAGEGEETTNYDDMTVAELKDLAHKRGVEIHSDMLKDDIIAALEKADKSG